MRPNSALIEPRFRDSLTRYIDHGYQPGSFITAVLENDLMEAFGRGDEMAIENLPHIVAYVYNELPGNSHGSPAVVAAWIASHRA